MPWGRYGTTLDYAERTVAGLQAVGIGTMRWSASCGWPDTTGSNLGLSTARRKAREVVLVSTSKSTPGSSTRKCPARRTVRPRGVRLRNRPRREQLGEHFGAKATGGLAGHGTRQSKRGIAPGPRPRPPWWWVAPGHVARQDQPAVGVARCRHAGPRWRWPMPYGTACRARPWPAARPGRARPPALHHGFDQLAGHHHHPQLRLKRVSQRARQDGVARIRNGLHQLVLVALNRCP